MSSSIPRISGRPGRGEFRQVLGHLADDERIFAYRALCIARGDRRELAGFDETLYELHHHRVVLERYGPFASAHAGTPSSECP